MKSFRHLNISENIVREACLAKDLVVRHISGKVNISDLHTKEHKSDVVFREMRDAFMSPGPAFATALAA